MKRRFLLLCVAPCLAWAGEPIKTSAPRDRPNVVFIVVDDMNHYGFSHEHPGVKVPHLDAFRKSAVTFPRAVCNAPSCVPSRASFLSGQYPFTTGAYLNGSDPWEKPAMAEIESLPELFKRAGYAVWGAGKLFHAKIGAKREQAAFDNKPYGGGFGPFVPEKDQVAGNFWGTTPWTGPDTDFPDVVNTNAAVEFLRTPQEKPFLLMLGLWRPHTPFTAPKRFFDFYEKEKIAFPPSGARSGDLADVPEAGKALARVWGGRWEKSGGNNPDLWLRMLWGYMATTSFADESVGRVLAALDARPDRANTIVVFISDNGYHVGEKEHFEKSTLWDASARVPFAIRLPGGRNGGAVSGATVGLIDLFPTLMDYCGLPAPKQAIEGRTMRAVLENPSQRWDRPGITVYEDKVFSAADERHRYIQYADGTEELYDHRSDPHEFTNLAADPATTGIKERLRAAKPKIWAKSLGGREG